MGTDLQSVFASLGLNHLFFYDTLQARISSLDELQALNTVMGVLALLLFVLLGILYRKIHYITILEAEVRALSEQLEGEDDRLDDKTKNELIQMKESIRVKDQFIFVATHELRSTANAILWGLKELKLKQAHLPKSEESLYKGILDSGERQLQLVNDLAEVARIEGKTIQFNLKPISLKDVFSKVIIEINPLAHKKKITIHDEIPKRLPLVLVDPVRLEEVFINLLTNAIKYNKKGGEVSVFADEKGAHVEVHVKDNGIGIAPEDQIHLFEKFWRAKDVKAIEGTGLGLFIVKQMVELMSGKVWCESRKGVGSTFSFLLEKAQ